MLPKRCALLGRKKKVRWSWGVGGEIKGDENMISKQSKKQITQTKKPTQASNAMHISDKGLKKKEDDTHYNKALGLTGLRKGRAIWRRMAWKKLAGVVKLQTNQLVSWSCWISKLSPSTCQNNVMATIINAS